MTGVKRLLELATPLPWHVWDAWRPGIEGSGDPKGESIVVYGEFGEMEGVNTPENAALIVAAVNRLPDYLAAVEALETALGHQWEHDINCGIDALRPGANPCNCGVERDYDEASAALARLRESVPA